MQFVFIGNINNEAFRLAHVLSELGHRCTVALTQHGALHDPEQLLELEAYRDSRVLINGDLASFSTWDWITGRRDLKSAFRALTHRPAVVMTGDMAHSIAHTLDQPYLSLVTGSDVTLWASLPAVQRIRVRSPMLWASSLISGTAPNDHLKRFAERQSSGIRRSSAVLTIAPGVSLSMDAAFAEIGVYPERRTPWRIRTAHDWGCVPPSTDGLQVLVGSRLTTGGSLGADVADLNDKGTSQVLLGWAEAKRMGLRGQLTLFCKGSATALARFRGMATSLGLDDSVVWRREGSLQALLQEMSASHVVVDSLGSSPPGRVTVDGIASGRTVMTNVTDSVQTRMLGAVFPNVMPVSSSAEFAAALYQLDGSDQVVRTHGQASHRLSELLAPETMAKTFLREVASL